MAKRSRLCIASIASVSNAGTTHAAYSHLLDQLGSSIVDAEMDLSARANEGANAASMISSGGCMAVKPRAQRERKRFEIPFRSRRECRPRSQGCMRIGLQQSDSFTLSAACAEPMVLLRFAQTCWSDVAGPCANAVTSSDFLVTTSDRPPGSPHFICGWRGWHMSLAIGVRCQRQVGDSGRPPGDSGRP